MAVMVDKQIHTIADIDEALGYLVETLRQQPNPETFLAIVDELLDARNEIQP